jgi:2-dehydro-3-deoxygluconokinase
MDKLDIITIGECLVEFSTDVKLADAECLHKYYGGDALAAAVTAARLGAKTGFVTRVGEDCFKDFLIENWKKEGLDISHVKSANEQNGVYFIARPSVSEKEIVQYRKRIAPSKLAIEDISEDYIDSAKIVYATGITQALSLSAKEAVSYMFKKAKQSGVLTAYDPNFYPHIETPESARENFDEVIADVDVLFMSTKYDTTNILEIASAENAIKYLWDKGVGTVVIKSGADKGYYTGHSGNIQFTEFFTDNIVDTTCSGDVFNGGFMYALSQGYTPFEAARLALVTAGLQAGAIGAIKSIPYQDDVIAAFKCEECDV